MTYDPKQPRLPDGRYWYKNLAEGWQTYVKRNGDVSRFYYNNQDQLMSGSHILHVAAQGRVFTKEGQSDATERIHITGTEDGEMLAYASNDHGAFGIINHDREAPVDDLSFSRGHDFQPVGDRLPLDETTFGGRAANDVNNNVWANDVRTNERINREAFESPDARVFTVDPQDMAQRVVEVRQDYKDLGLSDTEARQAPVYVYFDKNGQCRMLAAYCRGRDGKVRKRRSPNAPASGSVKLTCEDVTRMTRAMEKEDIHEVNVSISGGTNISRNGTPIGHALHFRTDMVNGTTGDRSTMWGTIEKANKGTEPMPASTRNATPEERERYITQRAQIRKKAAEKFHEPKDSEQAARLLRAATGNRYIRADEVKVNRKGLVAHMGADTNTIYSPQGEPVGRTANNERGFTEIFNSRSNGQVTIREDEVLRNGNTYTATVRGANGNVIIQQASFDATGKRLSN